MTAKTKKPATATPVNFGWIKTKDGEPKVHKLPNNDIYSVSNMLLIHTKKQGALPGYFVKYQNDHLAATPPRSKGDSTFHSSDGTVLTDVMYFFEVRDIPAPVEHLKAQIKPTV